MLVFAVIFILINIAVDLLVALFNPRLRHVERAIEQTRRL